AGALLGDPRLLLVDDPLAPLSPAERRRYAAVVAELVQDGVAVVATARDAAALGVLPVTATVALHAGRVVARAPTVKSLEIDVASATYARLRLSHHAPRVRRRGRALRVRLDAMSAEQVLSECRALG